MNNIRKAVLLSQMVRRSMSQAVNEVPSPRFKKLKQIQAQYGVEDGVPSYKKGGAKDRILMYITVGLIAVGMGMATEVVYKLAVPQTES